MYLQKFSYAYGEPVCQGLIRTVPEDFIVDEILGFEPDGEGEHVLLKIQKRNTNTDWVAKKISQFVGVRQLDVSYAGLKDRNAVTTQWFSVRLAGKEEPDWSELNCDDYTVLEHHLHRRKLRRGALEGNRFKITVRELEGDLSSLESRLNLIRTHGVPNYFGEQRFGIDGSNLEQAEAMFSGKRIKSRHKRSMYLSAARSYLFNLYLSQRVTSQNWNKAIPGDVVMLSGTHSFFSIDAVDEEIKHRVEQFDLHPAAILWGRGQSTAHAEALELEKQIFNGYPEFCEGLEKAGLDLSRRSMRLMVTDLSWDIDSVKKQMGLEFGLPSGAYATSLLRELAQTHS
ncbi:MAG: tRNA pseudouridine(13) synthase TruD [Gammaproteobacteria bacterium]|nr:tRNA pseudouridine(13) synthase TruD [Gammaproteobacteria bacterium]